MKEIQHLSLQLKTEMMRRNKIWVYLLSSLLFLSCEQEIQNEMMINQGYAFLLGSYTQNEQEGIGFLAFDPENGVLEASVIAKGIQNPSFVVANKSQNLVFAVEETGGERGGKINSYAFDREIGNLELLDTQDTFGNGPCYIALDPSEEFVVVGNYSSGNFSVYRNKKGKLEHIQTIQHEGESIIKNRQSGPHVHSAVFHPDGKHLLVADLGTDKIHIYQFNPTYSVPFQPAANPYFEVSGGAGPRHLLVHPKGSPVYLVHELTAEVGVYAFEDSKMKHLMTLPLTAADFMGNVSAAEIRISPDANFIYVSNRGDANTISVFEIEKEGTLKWTENVPTGGIMPRNFIITKDGKFLLAGHQSSGNITVFERNIKTGKLSQLEIESVFQQPVYFHGLD
jgi:6-phosphogluconolactonase